MRRDNPASYPGGPLSATYDQGGGRDPWEARDGIERALARTDRDAEQGVQGDSWSRRALRLLRRVEGCGVCRLRLERTVDGQRQMMTIPMACGSRACESCGKKIRATAAERMERGPVALDGTPIPWRSVMTLTMRAYGVEGSVAWERMGSWVSRWMEAFKKRVREGGYEGPMSYARVIEPTKRGWPHVHILMAIPHRGYDQEEETRVWSARMWERVTGCYVSKGTDRKKDGLPHGIGADWQPIVSRIAAAQYLSLYLSKARLDIWHYATLGRKRVWSTSRDVRPMPRESKGWRMEAILQPYDDPTQDPDAAVALEEGGWIEQWSMESGVSLWVRPAPDVHSSTDGTPRWMHGYMHAMDTGPPSG